MTGGRDTDGGSIREKDDGGGPSIPGTAERTGTVWGMQEGDGGRIVGVPQGDTAWAGGRGAVELGSFGHRRRAADVLDGLPNQGRAAELPCRGLPRKGRDTDSDADAFLQLAFLGHRDHLVGGKHPTPKVLTMRHAGPMAGAQR